MEGASQVSLNNFFHQWLEIPGQPEISVAWTWNASQSMMSLQCQQQQEQFVFDFPLEMSVINENGQTVADTIILFDQNKLNFEWFIDGQPDSLLIDPNIKLLYERK